MKAVKCSWVDMQRIRQMLANGERGEQARLEKMLGCIDHSTVSSWRAAIDLLDAIEGKCEISNISTLQPSHATAITRHFRKLSKEWDEPVKEQIAEWVERVEEHEWTVKQLQDALADSLKPKHESNGQEETKEEQSEGTDEDQESEQTDTEDEQEEEDGTGDASEKSPLICGRCFRLGKPVRGCQSCERLRKQAEEEKRKKKTAIADDNGTAATPDLESVFQCVHLFNAALQACHRAVNALQAVESCPAYRVLIDYYRSQGGWTDYSGSVLCAIRALKDWRPGLVCDACTPVERANRGGSKCAKCKGKGWLSGEDTGS